MSSHYVSRFLRHQAVLQGISARLKPHGRRAAHMLEPGAVIGQNDEHPPLIRSYTNKTLQVVGLVWF
jgi:hypothetical protein